MNEIELQADFERLLVECRKDHTTVLLRNLERWRYKTGHNFNECQACKAMRAVLKERGVKYDQPS